MKKPLTLTTQHAGEFALTGPVTPPPANADERAAREAAVAHALSLLNRFTGHIPYPYSVAEHSTLAAKLWGRTPIERLAILLHDAHEAFMGDIASPVKAAIGETLLAECEGHLRWYESNMEYRLRVFLGFPQSGPLGVARSWALTGAASNDYEENDTWSHGHLAHRVEQADKGIYLAEEFVLRSRVQPALQAAVLDDEQRLLIQGAITLLDNRRSRLERAHHSLQLCFAPDPLEAVLAVAEYAPSLGLPREHLRFGWPAEQEYLAMLREARRETGL